MIVPAVRLTDLLTSILKHAGTEPGPAQICAAHLVAANLKGHDSHGAGMVPAYVRWIREGKLQPNAKPEVVHDRHSVLVVDGHHGLGQPSAQAAMQLAIKRGLELGVAAVALRNVSHIGRIGAYGEQCADAGLVSIHFVNAIGEPPAVAPFGGQEARMLTNPFCCAIPHSNGEHIVVDFATSAIAIGKLRVACMTGTDVSSGVLIDDSGAPTNDPRTFFKGERRSILLPFGLHKGGGMQILCEILGGALAGISTIRSRPNQGFGAAVNNMLTVVINPAAFGGGEAFQSEMGALLAYIRATSPIDGLDHVRVPGDPERDCFHQRSVAGVPIDQKTWQEICQTAESVGFDDPDFLGDR